MGLAAGGSVIILVCTIAGMSMVFGAVILCIFRGLIVDQTLGCGESLLLILGVLMMLAFTLLTWGTPWMVVPPTVGAALWFGWTRALRWHESRCAKQQLSQDEERALRLIDRDPTATIGYERLAEAQLSQGRRIEALETLERWIAVAPHDPTPRARLRDLRGPDGPPVAPPPPAARPERPPAPDLVEREPEPPPPPPRRTGPSEEERLRSFSAEAEPTTPDGDLLAFDPDNVPDE